MRHMTIIDGHPDPAQGRLTHALADRYVEAARAAGNEVRRIDIAHIDFPLLRDPDDFYTGRPPEPIREAQRDIAWADHLVFFYPLWDSDMPALLKAFIEQTFRPGFALDYGGARRFPKRLLTGKSARIVVTMGMPAFIYRSFFGAYGLRSFKLALRLCGINPVRDTLFGAVETVSPQCRKRWFARIAGAAERDGEGAGVPALVRALAASAAVGITAYVTYRAVRSLGY